MKLNGTIPFREVFFRDTFPGIADLTNIKFQAPNSNKISNDNIQ